MRTDWHAGDTGYDLILVARNRERLETLAKQLADDTGQAVEVVPANLNDDVDLERIERLLRAHRSITMLVNNAGVGRSDRF